jgi:hypothetical protein
VFTTTPEAALSPHLATPPAKPLEFAVQALAIKDGALLWRTPLPFKAVESGICVDREGRVIVSLQDGRVICFAP